ncbi:hypothetical protein [Azospirillum argentinense]|uniref:hypothetical protein n=1 Tax=Azospirillum argentinense TaxID=2970906 RepID=UPI0032E041D6
MPDTKTPVKSTVAVRPQIATILKRLSSLDPKKTPQMDIVGELVLAHVATLPEAKRAVVLEGVAP